MLLRTNPPLFPSSCMAGTDPRYYLPWASAFWSPKFRASLQWSRLSFWPQKFDQSYTCCCKPSRASAVVLRLRLEDLPGLNVAVSAHCQDRDEGHLTGANRFAVW